MILPHLHSSVAFGLTPFTNSNSNCRNLVLVRILISDAKVMTISNIYIYYSLKYLFTPSHVVTVSALYSSAGTVSGDEIQWRKPVFPTSQN